MKIKKFESLIFGIFACIGIILIIISVRIGTKIFNYENKENTIGTITTITSYRDHDGDRSYEVYVTYNVDGKKYETELNGYSSDFYEGKEIEIYYDKDNPNKIGLKSLDLLFLILPGMGLIFLAVGSSGIIVKIMKSRLEKRLKEHGELIYADYLETIINTSYTVNYKSPYNVICEWNNPEDNKKYIFRSKNIWFNPVPIIQEKNIKTFPIYLDRKNKKKYVIDVDSLTEDIVDLR